MSFKLDGRYYDADAIRSMEAQLRHAAEIKEAAEDLADAMRLTIEWLQLAQIDTANLDAALFAYRRATGESE